MNIKIFFLADIILGWGGHCLRVILHLGKYVSSSLPTLLTLQRGVTGTARIANTSPVVECRAVPACCTVLLIRLYLDNIERKCNRTASCVFVKELAL